MKKFLCVVLGMLVGISAFAGEGEKINGTDYYLKASWQFHNGSEYRSVDQACAACEGKFKETLKLLKKSNGRITSAVELDSGDEFGAVTEALMEACEESYKDYRSYYKTPETIPSGSWQIFEITEDENVNGAKKYYFAVIFYEDTSSSTGSLWTMVYRITEKSRK